MHKIQRNLARHLYTITQHENKSIEAYLSCFVKEEMNVHDLSDAAMMRALMAGLRNSTMLKYMVSTSENAVYPELIIEICHHIEAEKTSNLDASKLSQEVPLGGKHKLDA